MPCAGFPPAINVTDTCLDAVNPVIYENITIPVAVDIVNVPPVYTGPPNVSLYDNLDWARAQAFFTLPWYDLNNDSVTFTLADSNLTDLAGDVAYRLDTDGTMRVIQPVDALVDPTEYYMVVNMTDSGVPPLSTIFRVNITLKGMRGGGR